MKESFDNRSGSNTLHLAEFRRALGRTMDCARSRSASGADEPLPDACEYLVFAYAFGLAEGSGIIDLLGNARRSQGSHCTGHGWRNRKRSDPEQDEGTEG